jgi:hypothetical protein
LSYRDIEELLRERGFELDHGLGPVKAATMWAPDGRVLAVARQTRLAGT